MNTLLKKLSTMSFFLYTALLGVNIKSLLDEATLEEGGGKQLLDFQDAMGDRIQVILE